jgi:RNA polymerase sigma-70 factor (ECF subfamily)
MAKLANGDLGALGEIYDRHHEAVRRFVGRATSGASDSADLVQNTFLMLSDSARRFDGRESCRPFLIGIAAHLVQERARQGGVLARLKGAFARERPIVVEPGPRLEARSSLDCLTEALEKMKPAKRIVVLMAQVEGLTAPEIAEALGIPVGTVWTRLHAARRELRSALGLPEAP